MVQFKPPAAVGRSVLSVDRFLGVDLTSNPGAVANTMSPNGQNMIRDVPGKVRKCMGYHRLASYPGRINGRHLLVKGGAQRALIHAGTALYLEGAEAEEPDEAGEAGEAGEAAQAAENAAAPPAGQAAENAAETETEPGAAEPAPTPLYEGMADARSVGWQLGERLFILDGKAMLVYDGETVRPAREAAYLPTVCIGRAPAGGGTDYEPLNLLQPGFRELFAGTAADKTYCLTFSGLDETPVQAEKLTASGSWQTLTEGTDFTVDRAAGRVIFTAAPGLSPVTGEDNLRITAYRTVSGYAGRIDGCRIGVLFGVNGATDRLFVSGNPDYPNRDWYSGQYDPTYWPDTGYSQLGAGESAVVGYSIVNNYLAAHKDAREQDRSVILRKGDLIDSKPAFPVVNTLQGPGALAPHSFCYLGNEPVFLTPLGVYAITPSDLNGERYSQNRSYYINGSLAAEPGREEAFAFVYKDLYWLCLNDKAYILDGLQSLGQSSGEPYSTRQYACFVRTNLPARCLWEQDGALCFGTPQGDAMAFYTDPAAQESYNDDGAPIHAVWETPDLAGRYFYKNKRFCTLAVQLASAVATSVRLAAQRRGSWQTLRQENSRLRFFQYSQLDYGKFTYSGDRTAKTLCVKLRLKKLDKARFRLENDALNEPFGLMALAVEFIERGNFKG